MALIQELKCAQIASSLADAVDRGTPVSVTCCVDGNWHSLRSRFVALSAGGIYLERPVGRDGDDITVSVGMDLGVSFKLKHHKHLCNVTVETIDDYTTANGECLPAIRVSLPLKMQRVQRRAYQRADVPQNRSVLATLHLGASDDQGSGASGVWEGWVTNLSAGGFEVRLAHHGAPEMDVGDLVGVSIGLGQEFEPIEVTAQFRQAHTDERNVQHHGFQFVGLNETARGRRMLQRIGQIVCEFQRHGSRRRSA